MPGSTPWPKIARLIGLLEGSPDTFDQLARQEHFEPSRSRSTTTRAADKATGPAIQRSDQAVEAGAAVRSHTAGSGSGVETGAAGDAARDESVFETSPALVFVAGDRSQVTVLYMYKALCGGGGRVREVQDRKRWVSVKSLAQSMCVCVFFPSILDIKFVGRTSRGHTGGRSHRIFNPPSFCGACLDFCREKDSAIPFPRRP